MGGDQGNVGKEPQAVQDALDSDIPQGLNSKKVNYNLSNKRQLVGHGKAWHLATCNLARHSCVLQTGMGYGMYTLVLPFFAWMIVLVVSTVQCKSFAAASINVAVVSTDLGLLYRQCILMVTSRSATQLSRAQLRSMEIN